MKYSDTIISSNSSEKEPGKHEKRRMKVILHVDSFRASALCFDVDDAEHSIDTYEILKWWVVAEPTEKDKKVIKEIQDLQKLHKKKNPIIEFKYGDYTVNPVFKKKRT